MALSTDLEAYYKFNNNGNDSSGNGRDLTFSGTEAYTTGLFNSGYSLTGIDTNFATGGTTPEDAILNFNHNGAGTKYTISAWVNFTSLAGEQTIVEKFIGPTGPGWTITKLGFPNPDDVFRFAADAVVIDTTNLATTGSFLHLVVRSDGTNVEFFFNGSSAGTAASPAISTTSTPLLIGERQGGQSHAVNGVIDEVALWSRDLSNAEIAQVYNGGSGLELSPAPQESQSSPLRYVRDAGLVPRDSAPFRYVRDAGLVPRDSVPFRYVRGAPFSSFIRTGQVAFRTIASDRLTNPPVDVLRFQSSFDLTQTRVFDLYTIPANKNGIVLGIFFEAVSASNVTVVPTVSVGISSGETDIFPAESMLNFTTLGDVWSNWLVLTKAQGAVATEIIKLNVVGATADRLLADIHLVGFEY
jgi:hypothetical protein